MNFKESPGNIDPARALIYLWEILDSHGNIVYRYVGKASGGAHRPRTQYKRNVINLLTGQPYRKSKPTKFRPIHRRMAQAVKAGETIRLSFICNVSPVEDINQLERYWQNFFGLRNG